MVARSCGANLEIPPWFVCGSNLGPLSGSGTVHGGQFDWGGLLPKLTEEFEGTLGTVGNRADSAMA